MHNLKTYIPNKTPGLGVTKLSHDQSHFFTSCSFQKRLRLKLRLLYCPQNQYFIYFTKHTWKPSDLCGATVSLPIAGSDPQYDGGFGGVVYLGRSQTGSCDHTSRGGATVQPQK